MIGKKIIALGFRVSLAVSCLHLMVLGTPNAQGQSLDSVLNNAKVQMESAVKQVMTDVSGVLLGRATVGLLDPVMVDYFGMATPLTQVATVSIGQDPAKIVVAPFDPALISGIESAIRSANLGVNASNDGVQIIVSVPGPTQERRQELVRQTHKIAEDGRNEVRRIETAANDSLKKLLKDLKIDAGQEQRGREEVMKVKDACVGNINKIQKEKEDHILAP